MNACSGSSGGVMFIQDTVERETNSKSYKEFVQDEATPKQKRTLFGRKKKDKKPSRKAA